MIAPAEPATAAAAPRRRRLRRAAGVLLYLLVVAAFAEGSARWFFAGESRLRRVASAYDDPSWRLRWVRRQGNGPTFRFRCDVPHRVRGWALQPRLRDVPMFVGGATLSSNAAGFRGVREYAVPKPPGVRRIVVIGDSFTFGERVADRHVYTHVLEELLPGTEVLNFGVHGYGHDQMLLYLRETAARYEPDVVLLGFVADDTTRNVLGFRDFAKPRFELEDGRLRLRGVPVPTPEQVRRAEPYRSKLADVVAMLRSRLAWRSGAGPRQATELTTAILAEIWRQTKAMGAQPWVADLPAWHELDIADPAPTPREQTLADLCARHGVPYVPLRPLLLARRGAGARFETSEHWGPVEHRVAAEGIAAALRRAGAAR